MIKMQRYWLYAQNFVRFIFKEKIPLIILLQACCLVMARQQCLLRMMIMKCMV